MYNTINTNQITQTPDRISYFPSLVILDIQTYKAKEILTMKKYVCEPCGYEYDPAIGDPDNGIEPGTAFEDLPEDWVCPICGLGKDVFAPED